MSPLTQVSSFKTLIGKIVFSPSYGVVTISDYIPGNVWSVEISIDGRPVQWVMPADIFIIELGDTVVVNDYGVSYVGAITRVYANGLEGRFQIDGRVILPRFTFDYVIEILPADVGMMTSAV